MQLGEASAMAMIEDENHDENTCVFCQAGEPPKEIINDLEEKSQGDEEDETGDEAQSYKFKNDSDTLGKNLGGRPKSMQIPFGEKSYDAMVAAHHLIPGNASLKKSTLFKSKKYLWKDGKAKGNIGYNINGENNGIWSPGNYGVRPWGTKGKTFETNSRMTAEQFAFAAMKKCRVQFHDAHPKYSKFVKDALDKVYEKLKNGEDIWCLEAKKKEKSPEEKDPLYVLVHRLDEISARMKRMLCFPTSNWKSNIYTSSFVKEFMKKEQHQDK